MSLQKKLERSSVGLRRKLHDNNIRLAGIDITVTRFHIEEDMYGNEQSMTINHDDVEVVLVYPSEIPLTRFRYGEGEGDTTDQAQEQSDETHVFFFDILPIELHAKWSDNIEKGDLLFHTVLDEDRNKIPILLRVSNDLGAFQTTLLWRKYLCAPYNGIIPPEVQEILDQSMQ
jgi:hypothetical protein